MGTTNKQTKPRRQHWSDHNVIVTLGAIAGAITLVAFGMGLQTLLTADSDSPSETINPEQDEQAASPEVDVTVGADTTVEISPPESSSATSEKPVKELLTPTVLLTQFELAEAISSGTENSAEDINLNEAIQMGGIDYPEATTISVTNSDWLSNFFSEAQFDLGRNYETFSGILGMPDDALSTEFLRVQLLDENNKVLFEKDTTIGSEESIEVDVTDVLRLKILVTYSGPMFIDESTRVVAFANAGFS